jgi:dUTP pyrophosphatase
MDRQDIMDYIKKLQELEKEIMDEDSDDLSFIGDMDKLMNNLSSDISVVQKIIPINVKIKKLNQLAVIPTYSKNGDAGMDLTITSVISETDTNITYGFGISIEIPPNYVGLIFPRSSIRKQHLLLSNSVGVIDSGYRGEIQATFKKTKTLPLEQESFYSIGERGAQIMIIPYPQIKFEEVDELSNSERGNGGFGSTGS